MRAFRAALMRLTGALGGTRRDVDFAEELQSHVQLHIEDNLRTGMTPDEARREALDVAQIGRAHV